MHRVGSWYFGENIVSLAAGQDGVEPGLAFVRVGGRRRLAQRDRELA